MNRQDRRLAVIDMGSHSILLLAARTGLNGHPKVLAQRFLTSRLAENMDAQNRIPNHFMERISGLLTGLKTELDQFGIKEVYPIGTEALRRAANTSELVQVVKDRLGWELKIISRDEEAALSFYGATADYSDEPAGFLVLDVGGGSTEFAYGVGKKPDFHQSLELGAVSLAKTMNFQEILCSSDRLGIMNLIKIELLKIDWLDRLNPECTVIATGGTVSTLAAIKHKMTDYDSGVICKTSLSRDEIRELFLSINAMSVNERKQVPGLDAGREHILIYGILIILTFMQMKQIEIIRVSDKGLRFGYLKQVLT